MIKSIFKYIGVTVFSTLIIFLMYRVMWQKKTVTKEIDNLVVFGENTTLDEKHKAFIEDECIYVALSTFSKLVDEDISYDEVTEKVIITNYDNVAKLKVDSNIINVNFEDKEISHVAKKKDEVLFIPLSDLVWLYDITLSYNEESKTASIDSKDLNTSKVKYNNCVVYSDITTKSTALQNLKYGEDVVVYDEALTHNRWYKVKTLSGNVGYMFKTSVDFIKKEDTEQKKDEEESKEKVVMAWQYGSSLSNLGTSKIPGLTVVSPTGYYLANKTGDVSGNITSGYVDLAHRLGYKVWGLINNGFDSRSYSSQDTSELMNSEIAREKLIKNILAIVDRDNLDGINIDFEQMKEEDRESFTQFIRELAPLMRKKGKVLSVDLYFVRYIDRAKIGESADYVVFMGYDQNGSWSETAGSVSSLSWVNEKVTSLLNDSKISPNKIILGIPFYTRLWQEKSGTLNSTIYTMIQAANYISQNGISTVYNEPDGQNYFEYTRGNVTYKMWVEDKTSTENRVDVVNNNNLAGISAWRLGFETNDIWNSINEKINK